MKSLPSRLLRATAGLFSVLSLAFLMLALPTALVLQHGVGRSGLVKKRVEALIRGAAGNDTLVSVGNVTARLRSDGSVQVELDDVRIGATGAAAMLLERVNLRAKVLSLVQGRVEITHAAVRGVDVDLARALPQARSVDVATFVRNFDLKAGSRAAGRALTALENALRDAGVETIALADVRLAGLARWGLRSNTAYLPQARLEVDARYVDGLTLVADMRMGSAATTALLGWHAADSAQTRRTLSATIRGLDLGQLPRVLTRGTTPLEIAAPLDLSGAVPFDAKGDAGLAHISVDVGAGEIWFGDVAPTAISSARGRLRIDPARNSLAVLPFRVRTASVDVTVEGGIARRSPTVLDFELGANDMRSRAGGVSSPQVASWVLGGSFDAPTRRLDVERLELGGVGGTLSGSGAIDLSAWAPGIRFEAQAPRLELDTLKAFWPPFLAPPVRRWALQGIEGGELVGATASFDIPTGVIDRIRDEGALGPAGLSMVLPVRKIAIRTTGDLPAVMEASGTARLVGASLSGSLSEGRIADLDLAGSRLTVANYLVRGLPARLEIAAKGPAEQLLKLAGTQPLQLRRALGLSKHRASGTVRLAATVDTPLKPKPGTLPDDWSAILAVADGGFDRPLRGRRFADADVTIRAAPGRVSVDGTATVDGLRTRLALVEPLGSSKKRGTGSQQVAFRLDDTDRRKFGIDLGRTVQGPVDVRLRSVSDGWQIAKVDLTAAALELAFLDWRKGRGVPARASFRFRTRNGKTEVADFEAGGEGFSAKGNLALDEKGLAVAVLDRVALSAKDEARVTVGRRKGGYDVRVEGRRFDARSLLALMFGDRPTSPTRVGSESERRLGLNVTARFEEVHGFGGRIMRDTKMAMRLRGAAITSLDLAARVQNRPLRVRMAQASGLVGLDVDASDAGGLLRFADLYGKMRGGTLQARLRKDRSGVYQGDVSLSEFALVDEPKVKALIDGGGTKTGGRRRSDLVQIAEASATVRRSRTELLVGNGKLRGGDMAATFEGVVYDGRGRMKMKGTFLPAYGLNRLVSAIPFVGQVAGNGRKSGLLGITFRLSGPWREPQLALNPLSLLTPGRLRKVFE